MILSQIQLIKRIEPPVVNNNFCRRVRDSMGLQPPPQIAEESDDSYSSAEETIEIVEEPTPKCSTVRKVVPFPTRVELLERENRRLREELSDQRDKIHDE